METEIFGRLSQFKYLMTLASQFAFIEAINRVEPSSDDDADWTLLPEGRRVEIAVHINDAITSVLTEWQSVMAERSNEDISEPSTNCENWLVAHQEASRVTVTEAVHRLMERQGFNEVEPEDYLNLFPEDLRDLLMSDIGASIEAVEIEWNPIAVECFYSHSREAIEEMTGIKLG